MEWKEIFLISELNQSWLLTTLSVNYGFPYLFLGRYSGMFPCCFIHSLSSDLSFSQTVCQQTWLEIPFILAQQRKK